MFPVLVDYEEGIESSGDLRFVNAGVYLLWIRDTYIQDTPFTYADVREIHSELREVRPLKYRYDWKSLRDILRVWVQEGLIVPLDPYGRHTGEYTLMWKSYYRKQMLRRNQTLDLEAKLEEIAATFEYF